MPTQHGVWCPCMNYARLLHMTNTDTQTRYPPTWRKIQTRTAGRSFDTCFSVTPRHSGTHLSCKLTSAAIHMRLSVTAFPLTFWPQMYVKEGGRGVQVGCLTALDSGACWRACFVPSFSHRYYSSYIKAVQVCGWNICFYLLRQLEDFQYRPLEQVFVFTYHMRAFQHTLTSTYQV